MAEGGSPGTPQLQRMLEMGTGTAVPFDAAQRDALEAISIELEDDEQPLALLVADNADVDGTRAPGVAVLTDRRLLFSGARSGVGVSSAVALTSIDDLVMASRLGIGTLHVGSQNAPLFELSGATSAVTAAFLHSLRSAIDTRRKPAALIAAGAAAIARDARRTSWFAPATAAFVVLLVGSIAIAQFNRMDTPPDAATVVTPVDDAASDSSDALAIVVTTTGATPPPPGTAADDSTPHTGASTPLEPPISPVDSTTSSVLTDPTTASIPAGSTTSSIPAESATSSVVVSSPTTTEAVSVAPPTLPKATAPQSSTPTTPAHVPSTTTTAPSVTPYNTNTTPTVTTIATSTTASQPVVPPSSDAPTTAVTTAPAPTTAAPTTVPPPTTAPPPPPTTEASAIPSACTGAITAVNPGTVSNDDDNGPSHADVTVTIEWSGPCVDLRLGYDRRNSPGSSFRWVKTRGNTTVTIIYAGGESWVDGPHTIILAEGRGSRTLASASLTVL